MIKVHPLFLAMLSVCFFESFSHSSTEAKDAEPPFFIFKMNKKPVLLPEGSSLLKDLSYGSDSAQKLDVYLPKKEILQKKAPFIIMVHGGAWMVGDKSFFPVVQNKIDRWLKKGIIFVSVNYRMSHSPNPLQQVDDLDSALNYIQINAEKYGGDPNKIVLMGHSAGAHLVSLLASSEEYQKSSKLKWLGTVALDSAAFDLVEQMQTKHPRFYDRVFGSEKKNWQSNSPFYQIDRKILPMLIVCSQKRPESCPQAQAFKKKAESFSSNVVVLPVDLEHGDINLNLGLDGKYTDDIEQFLKTIGVTGI